jgi:hypothetical protein
MENNEVQPQTFVAMVLALLEDRFPWLGTDEPASGAETVDELSDLHESLQKAQVEAQRKKPTDH